MRIAFDESRRAATKGFTLVEIMAVVVIIGMLTALVGVSVYGQLQQARRRTTEAQLAMLEHTLEMFAANHGRYPTTTEGLAALVEPPEGLRGAQYYPEGGYIRRGRLLLDGWQNQFGYESPGRHNPRSFDLWSNGRDGEQGGEGVDSDIGNWTAR